MKKIIKWSLIGFISLIVIGAIASRGGDKNTSVKETSREGQEEAQETTNIKQSESRLTTSENGKKIFNELGWNLYKAQFIKPEPGEDKDCFKDKTTCPYWERLAKEFDVQINDVKYVLYYPSNIALNEERQKIYDEFHSGLKAIQNKTDEAAEKYTNYFTKERGIEKYELDAIVAKGDLYKGE